MPGPTTLRRWLIAGAVGLAVLLTAAAPEHVPFGAGSTHLGGTGWLPAAAGALHVKYLVWPWKADRGPGRVTRTPIPFP